MRTDALLESGGFPQFQRRFMPACKDLMFISQGDSNGLSHWLGTCEGRQDWVNPLSANTLQVSSLALLLVPPCTCSPGW